MNIIPLSTNFAANKIGQKQKTNFKGQLYTGVTEDTFVRTCKEPDKEAYDKSFNYAKDRCIEKLLQNPPVEHVVCISKNGEILEEATGDTHSCDIDRNNLEEGATIIHGHPSQYEQLSPLSADDIACFLVKYPKIGRMIAIDKNGETCELIKPKGFKAPSENDEIAFREKLMTDFKKEFVEYYNQNAELSEEYIEDLENKLKAKLNKPDLDIYKILFGEEKPKDLEERFNMLKPLLEIHSIEAKLPLDKHFMELLKENANNFEDIIEIQRRFVEKTANKYGLTLEYNKY